MPQKVVNSEDGESKVRYIAVPEKPLPGKDKVLLMLFSKIWTLLLVKSSKILSPMQFAKYLVESYNQRNTISVVKRKTGIH